MSFIIIIVVVVVPTLSQILLLKSRCYVRNCVTKSDELNRRDAAGDDDDDDERELWIAYCAFHLADYASALQVHVVTWSTVVIRSWCDVSHIANHGCREAAFSK